MTIKQVSSILRSIMESYLCLGRSLLKYPYSKFTVRNMTRMPIFAQSSELSVSYHMTENVGIHLYLSMHLGQITL